MLKLLLHTAITLFWGIIFCCTPNSPVNFLTWVDIPVTPRVLLCWSVVIMLARKCCCILKLWFIDCSCFERRCSSRDSVVWLMLLRARGNSASARCKTKGSAKKQCELWNNFPTDPWRTNKWHRLEPSFIRVYAFTIYTGTYCYQLELCIFPHRLFVYLIWFWELLSIISLQSHVVSL